MSITIKKIKGLIQATSPWFDTGWITIPGIGAASAYADLDAFGTIFEIPNLPHRGIFLSARMLDLDHEGSTGVIDLHLFRNPFTATVDNAAFAISDADVRYGYECSITINVTYDNNTSFFTVKDALNTQFWAPRGKLYAQAQIRGAANIAAGSEPLIRLMGLVLVP